MPSDPPPQDAQDPGVAAPCARAPRHAPAAGDRERVRRRPLEHLSADEVHARASSSVPDIGRGTVYATLAELTELGLLAAHGSPEPVRYEINAAAHDHFRCRLCLRLYDVELPAVRVGALTAEGFAVEHTSVTVEGVCADCVRYDAGLREGVRRSVRGPAAAPALPAGLACAGLDTPVGTLLLAASADGLVRVVYDDHADAPALRELLRRRRGGQAARGHLEDALAMARAYFAGDPAPPSCAVDWDAVEDLSVSTLQAVQSIGSGQTRSYAALRSDADAHERGRTLGANPLAIVVPCHRVTRGREITDVYVGGAERKQLLRRHEDPA